MLEAALGRKALQGDPAANASAIDHLTRAIKLGFTAPAAYEDLAERRRARAAKRTPLQHSSTASNWRLTRPRSTNRWRCVTSISSSTPRRGKLWNVMWSFFQKMIL
jgi:hypothetical protein